MDVWETVASLSAGTGARFSLLPPDNATGNFVKVAQRIPVRRELVLENLTLRQQLATVLQKRRPLIQPADRAFWVVMRRLWTGWSDAVVIVKPETVVGWHRAGFAL